MGEYFLEILFNPPPLLKIILIEVKYAKSKLISKNLYTTVWTYPVPCESFESNPLVPYTADL